MKQIIRDYLLLLRLPYNLLILSGGFLVGLLFESDILIAQSVISFLIIECLLMGGMNLLNSAYDRDEGPIGGLFRPPRVPDFAIGSSWILQISAVVLLAHFTSISGALLALVSIALSWAYSHPLMRLKGKPYASIVSVMLGNFILVLMGFLSGGGTFFTPPLLAMATAFSVLSAAFYPISQLYQIEVDRAKGDLTFAVKHGVVGVRRLFQLLYPVGGLCLLVSVASVRESAAWLLLIPLVVIYRYVVVILSPLKGQVGEYSQVMRIKVVGGITLSIGTLALLALRF